jgi:hypothetical protein
MKNKSGIPRNKTALDAERGTLFIPSGHITPSVFNSYVTTNNKSSEESSENLYFTKEKICAILTGITDGLEIESDELNEFDREDIIEMVADALDKYVKHTEVDDVPVDAATTAPISSNWAYDHVAAADPHTGYRLESANHTHATTGAQAGQLDHGNAMVAASLLDDDHTQYVLKSLFNADTFLYATSDDTPVATSPANVLAALTGHAGAAFSWNSQNLTSVGTVNTHTIPAGTDTFCLLAASQALTTKTYNGLTVTTTAGTLTIANNASAALVTSGNFSITLTATNATSVTLPTTGTLATLAGAETFTGKVSYNGLIITADTGAITTGSWHGTTIAAEHGGTGVANNTASTLTITGAFATTLTVTNATSVTLPTTGTLATLSGVEELDNKTLDASVLKGTFTASGVVTMPALTLAGAISGGDQSFTNVGDMTFAAGSIIASGSTNTNTLLIRANDTTFITLTTAATDTCEITNGTLTTPILASLYQASGGGLISFPASVGADTVCLIGATQELDNKTLDASVAKGTWTASGTWTIPAITLAGAITGGSQNITGLGTVAATSYATTAATPLLLTNGKLVSIALTSQTINPTTLTIPDFASVSDTFAFITLAQVLVNKTLTSPTINGTIATTGLTLPAVTLGGVLDANNQNITRINRLLVNSSGNNNTDVADDGALGILFRTATAADAGITNRLAISGNVATAVATWSNITHTGIKLSGAILYGANQVVGARVVNAGIDDVIEAAFTTLYPNASACLAALQAGIQTHGLITPA